jgi:hypothetical protein
MANPRKVAPAPVERIQHHLHPYIGGGESTDRGESRPNSSDRGLPCVQGLSVTEHPPRSHATASRCPGRCTHPRCRRWWTNDYMTRGTGRNVIDAEAMAIWAYEYADAMVAERAK